MPVNRASSPPSVYYAEGSGLRLTGDAITLDGGYKRALDAPRPSRSGPRATPSSRAVGRSMVFETPSPWRWRITLSLSIVVGLTLAIVLGGASYRSAKYPPIPPEAMLVTDGASDAAPAERTAAMPTYDPARMARTAFVSDTDPESVLTMKDHLAELDAVFPLWFTFTGSDASIRTSINASVLEFLRARAVLILPRIANLDSRDRWTGASLSGYLSKPENRTSLSRMIVDTLEKHRFPGVNLDFEELRVAARADYTAFVTELSGLLRARHLSLTIDVPMRHEAYDHHALGAAADALVVMAYDAHNAKGSSGPVASEEWFRSGIERILREVPRDKVVVSLGQYAYDWNLTADTSESLGYGDALERAQQVAALPRFDEASRNSRYTYTDSNGNQHDVWLLDALSLWNQLRFLAGHQVYGVSLWRLGLEDTAVWSFYGHDLGEADPSVLGRLPAGDAASPVRAGTGELLKVTAAPQEGTRRVELDDAGTVRSASYERFPQGHTVQLFGHSDQPKLALTFDDGPDPAYTEQVLEVLRRHRVTATFFVTGAKAREFPQIVVRTAAEGHHIGLHTYYHPDTAVVSASRLQIELEQSQRLIRALTGKNTWLFRRPYSVTSEPTGTRELDNLLAVTQQRYVVVNSDIDSKDYENPGVETIISTTLTQVQEERSNIVLMHDGGDRAQTVAALDALIPQLKEMGCRFVTVADLMDVPVDTVMPSLTVEETLIGWYDKFWDGSTAGGWQVFAALVALVTVVTVLRMLVLGFFVLLSAMARRSYEPLDETHLVTVLIPAYNEEDVIAKTLEGVLNSGRRGLEVLVIDDGSTDATGQIAAEFVASHPNVRLITKPNGGKASALNLGFTEATAECVVTIDADTMVLPETINRLVAPLGDPQVDAVCGNIRVGNARSWLTRFQAIEYITGQNFDRRGFDPMNAIVVVPGATGAWRRSRVLEVGGYSDQTLTEDADLTFSLLANGARIIYAPDAIALTEAPETVGMLYKQRFRWGYGAYQCLWKHRRSFFKGRLGWITLPNMLLLQVLLPLVSPLIDLTLIAALVTGRLQAVLPWLVFMVAIDLLASVLAFVLDRAPMRLLWLLIPQRFCYRYFMYALTAKYLIAIMGGRRHGWNKLERRNTVPGLATAE